MKDNMRIKEKAAEVFRCGMTMISPSLNTKVCYRVKTGKKLDLKNPTGFKEKLLKLKLDNYDHNPLVKQCADKYLVRDYVCKQLGYEVGQNVLNSLIATYNTVEEIEWNKLPDKFAIKWNFGCGYNLIVPDKSKLDIQSASDRLKCWGKKKAYLGYAEMQYKGVDKKILVERYLESKHGGLPEDYKVYCFSGKPVAILYISERGTGSSKGGFFDLNWNYLGVTGKETYKEFTKIPDCPGALNTMLEVSRKLSVPFPFVRVDFYDVDGKAVFGEMTFTPAGGSQASEIDINGISMGELLDLNYSGAKYDGGTRQCEKSKIIIGGGTPRKQ